MNANLRPILAQATNLDKSVPSTPKKSPVASNVCHSTGLKVLSVTSSVSGYVFTANDRVKLVRTIPGLVIINTAGKGDSLMLGVDVEDDKLSSLLLQLEKDLNNWNISCVDTMKKDTFSYFDGWKLIPRVDKSGMYQLIVSLRTQGRRSRDAEMGKRNQLLDLIKGFNIAKIVHGEGETILLIGHVLECVAYSDCIRNQFVLERRHTWQSKPTKNPRFDSLPGQERLFWVKVDCPELRSLSTAHKQFSVYHQLSTIGNILQLEHQLFGAVDNYLVVFSETGDTKTPILGQEFCFMELWQDSLPDVYTPTFGVDTCGFYSVSGKFPENLSNETRNKFAEDMKSDGAVGFRSGEAEDAFSLHFVNSRCLEQISRCNQYSSFRLTVLSSLVRKPTLDRKLKKLVPAILKVKELKSAEKSNAKNVSKVEAEKEDPEQVKEKSIEAEESKLKARSQENDLKMKLKTGVKLNLEKDVGEKFKLKEAEVSLAVTNSGLQDEDVQPTGGEKSTDEKFEMKTVENEVKIGSTAQLSEAELLRICWKD